jgi:hypothetical protein
MAWIGMPWNQTNPMDGRIRFIAMYLKGAVSQTNALYIHWQRVPFSMALLGANRVRVKSALRVHTNHASPALDFVIMPWHGTLKSSVTRPEPLLNLVSNLGT